ncbi:MAG TPA: glycoside hydrolase family 36 protein [Kribbella sp.]|uniref:glycoside hydrolase family 36 protein n=1 Tax=Kribbella sp. TaxID=1871183 RepID=UPI002D77142C|nr:glycoside hydrolase family 36 protein [Kribbella sp.]HET6299437.1 glycoside hydrolase family 36 protein [Kribbella sp.]
MGFTTVTELEYDAATARVYEHGWQSWSPSGWYSLDARPPRPTAPNHHVMAYRPDVEARGFQGEGLLAVSTGDDVLVVGATTPDLVPSIRCEARGDRLVISADDEVELTRSAPANANQALADWADTFGSFDVRVFGPSWCSWYAYWGKVTERDVMAEVRQFDDHGLSVDLVLLDEGYQAEIGDWLTPRDDFGSTVRLAADIRSGGRRAGIWVAPFLLGSKSETARLHPDWLVPGVTAGTNWGQEQLVLDVTHPGAARHLQDVFTELCRQGYDHFKLDFLYAGAIEGRRHIPLNGIAAYRHGLRLIREAVGPNRILHGCGAPILPSLGLVDCMRVSPDTDPLVDPPSGDISQPGQRGARSTSVAREFLHGRWWANDPDCLIVQPDIQDRERWAEHVENAPGLRMSSDPIGSLDRWGLDRTRELLTPSSARPHPLKDPDA